MNELATYAAIAEIFGAVAIVGGGLFGLVQLAEFRKRRRTQAAAELCRTFMEPELARAITLLRSLPDGAGVEEFRARGPEYEEAAQIVGMSFETMGLLVHENIASFRIVQELTGGLLLMMWRKIGTWVQETRIAHGNPRFGEWVQWLAERIEEREADMRPAHEIHRDWSKHRR